MTAAYESTESIVDRIVNSGVMKSIDEVIKKKSTTKFIDTKGDDLSELFGWRTEKRVLAAETQYEATKKKTYFGFHPTRDYTKTRRPVKFDSTKHEIVAVIDLPARGDYKVFQYEQTCEQQSKSDSQVVILQDDEKTVSNKADYKVEIIEPLKDDTSGLVHQFTLEEGTYEDVSRAEAVDFSKVKLEAREFSDAQIPQTCRPERHAVRRSEIDDPGKISTEMVKVLLMSQECGLDMQNDTGVIFKTETERLMATYDYAHNNDEEKLPSSRDEEQRSSGFIHVSRGDSNNGENEMIEGEYFCHLQCSNEIGTDLQDELIIISMKETSSYQPVIRQSKTNRRYMVEDDENYRIDGCCENDGLNGFAGK